MANKNKNLIIFIIIIIILLGSYPRLEIQAIQTAPTNRDCVERDRYYPDYQCVGPVVSWTPTMTSCLNACSYPPAGVCGFYVHWSEEVTCQSAYSTYQSEKCAMDCMYGGLPVDSCSDSDGLDYYNKGTTTNHYGFSIEDTCDSSSLLIEYYCENNKITNVGISCGCVNGACDSSICTVPADTSPCDGIVSRTELGTAISYWVSGLMSRTDLGTAIQKWVANG